MADEGEGASEGWSVPHRPAVIAALVTPVVLLILLLGTGWLYDRDLRPTTRQPVTPFPAPGLETYIHDGVRDPHPPAAAVTTDAQVDAAKHAVVAEGIAGWEARR